MKLEALCEMSVAGRKVAAGECFEADPDSAAKLLARRHAKAAKSAPKRAPKKKSESPEPDES